MGGVISPLLQLDLISPRKKASNRRTLVSRTMHVRRKQMHPAYGTIGNIYKTLCNELFLFFPSVSQLALFMMKEKSANFEFA